MRKSVSRQEALDRAAYDLRYLIIYYNIIRPQRLPYFRKNGKFSLSELKRQKAIGLKSLSKIKAMKLSKKQFGEFLNCQSHCNWTFGVSKDKLEEVLGSYRDENGIRHRIHLQDVLPIVESILGCTIKVMGHGRTLKGFGTPHKLMMDESVSDKYFRSILWSDIYHCPGVSVRFKEIVERWISEELSENKEPDEDNTMKSNQEIYKETLTKLSNREISLSEGLTTLKQIGTDQKLINKIINAYNMREVK